MTSRPASPLHKGNKRKNKNNNGYSGEDDRWHSNATNVIARMYLETNGRMQLFTCGPFHTSHRVGRILTWFQSLSDEGGRSGRVG